MKEVLIAALSFPRFHVRNYLELDNCTHNGCFDEKDKICTQCGFSVECRWLCHYDEFVALREKTLPELIEALEFSIGYIDSHITEWRHNKRLCKCDTCRWARDAKKLIHQLACEYEQQQANQI